MQGDQATGHPVVPSPAVVGISPVMSSGIPVMHQYGLQQQPLTSMSQALPVLQTSIPQLHAQPHVLSTPHHPQQQVSMKTFYPYTSLMSHARLFMCPAECVFFSLLFLLGRCFHLVS